MDLINDIQLLFTSSELCVCYFQSVPVFIVSSGQFRYVVSPIILKFVNTGKNCDFVASFLDETNIS